MGATRLRMRGRMFGFVAVKDSSGAWYHGGSFSNWRAQLGRRSIEQVVNSDNFERTPLGGEFERTARFTLEEARPALIAALYGESLTEDHSLKPILAEAVPVSENQENPPMLQGTLAHHINEDDTDDVDLLLVWDNQGKIYHSAGTPGIDGAGIYTFVPATGLLKVQTVSQASTLYVRYLWDNVAANAGEHVEFTHEPTGSLPTITLYLISEFVDAVSGAHVSYRVVEMANAWVTDVPELGGDKGSLEGLEVGVQIRNMISGDMKLHFGYPHIHYGA